MSLRKKQLDEVDKHSRKGRQKKIVGKQTGILTMWAENKVSLRFYHNYITKTCPNGTRCYPLQKIHFLFLNFSVPVQ